jgi:L-cysteine:1D-myo-inositol 2-amino-2-deoxy-alpha-D-glucopyranoside ligase
MHSWIAPPVGALPGVGPSPSLHDTARGGVYPTGVTSAPRTLYVCGITPYDAAHLGHAATMIAFDLVNRAWRDSGQLIAYVQNVTDVDDPLLERARRDGEDWLALADRETQLFREDMQALRILPPAHYVGAVESIPAIAMRVADLLEAGAAYRLSDGSGDLYFDLAAAPRFGYESHLDRARMLDLSAQRGGDPQRPGKRDPLDPLMWRGIRDGEPAWDGGVLGMGRPGWHIECSVIALDLLGESIDVQGGGSDLIFPHHECSAAHAEVLTGVAPFAGHFVHAGMIGLNGEKMSKSQGNLVFVSRLRKDGVDPMAMRLALLAGHYRCDRQWDDRVLASGQQRLALWRRGASATSGTPGPELLGGVRAALADDLDTPRALELIDRWCDAAVAGDGADPAAPMLMSALVDTLLGVQL